MKPLVYAAGPINGLDYKAATERREVLRKLLAPDIRVLSPMRYKDMLRKAGTIVDGQHLQGNPLTSDKGIVMRDRYDVKRCDLMVADLLHPPVLESWEWIPPGLASSVVGGGYYKPLKTELVSCGTPVEFGWANAFGKPIITVLRSGGAYDHPFIRALSDVIVETLDEAAEVVKAVLLTGD